MFCKPLIACMAVLVIPCVWSEEPAEGQYTEDIRAIKQRLEKLEKECICEKSPKTEQTANAAVAFHASYSNKSHLALKVGDILVFDKVTTNHGSGFNAVTGIFRASVAGTYHFAIHLMSHSNTLHIGIYKNDVRVANTYTPTYNTGSQSVIVDLEIGDKVYGKAYEQGTVHLGKFATFTGFRL